MPIQNMTSVRGLAKLLGMQCCCLGAKCLTPFHNHDLITTDVRGNGNIVFSEWVILRDGSLPSPILVHSLDGNTSQWGAIKRCDKTSNVVSSTVVIRTDRLTKQDIRKAGWRCDAECYDSTPRANFVSRRIYHDHVPLPNSRIVLRRHRDFEAC